MISVNNIVFIGLLTIKKQTSTGHYCIFSFIGKTYITGFKRHELSKAAHAHLRHRHDRQVVACIIPNL